MGFLFGIINIKSYLLTLIEILSSEEMYGALDVLVFFFFLFPLCRNLLHDIFSNLSPPSDSSSLCDLEFLF